MEVVRQAIAKRENLCTIVIKTGDHKGSGTVSPVYITMHNASGSSPELQLGLVWREDFQKGSLDSFNVTDVGITDRVDSIEVRLGDVEGSPQQTWYIETIHITFPASADNETSAFPLHRWIEEGERLLAVRNDSTLPQEETNESQRQNELVKKKELYQLELKSNGDFAIAQVANLPAEQNFSNRYFFDVLAKRSVLYKKESVSTFLTTERWNTLDDLMNVYNETFPVPYGAENWRKDNEFAGQRLTGCNPNQIRLCCEIPKKFAVTDAMLQPLMEGKTIAEALQDKKLFIINYEILKNLPTPKGRLVCAPMALFFVNKSKTLLPVAIQLYQKPAQDNPVFLPSDPEYTWLLAKMWFNNADSAVHESLTHLGFTHLIVETMAVAASRSLSPSHPVYKLLAPHFHFLMAINSFGLETLISPDGVVQDITNIGTVGFGELLQRAVPDWRLDVDGNFPADLRRRGLDDPDLLPGYHYRDDAILLHAAVKKYAAEVVNKRYYGVQLLSGDDEIQEFAATLVRPIEEGGCGLKGVPGNGKFATNDELIEVVTSIIFISSVGHAAANFNQYDEYGFPPNAPLWMNGTPPKDKTPLTEQDVLDSLPDKKTTLGIMSFTLLLSERATQRLGNFDKLFQTDKVGAEAAKSFQDELACIGEIIRSKDEHRISKYPYLDPREIPNSISI